MILPDSLACMLAEAEVRDPVRLRDLERLHDARHGAKLLEKPHANATGDQHRNQMDSQLIQQPGSDCLLHRARPAGTEVVAFPRCPGIEHAPTHHVRAGTPSCLFRDARVLVVFPAREAEPLPAAFMS
jgi:hypothetical protein